MANVHLKSIIAIICLVLCSIMTILLSSTNSWLHITQETIISKQHMDKMKIILVKIIFPGFLGVGTLHNVEYARPKQLSNSLAVNSKRRTPVYVLPATMHTLNSNCCLLMHDPDSMTRPWNLVYALWQEEPKLVYAFWSLLPVNSGLISDIGSYQIKMSSLNNA